ALRVRGDADLVDGAQVARRHAEGDEAVELGHPDAPLLHVDVLPALRLDVRVGNVLGEQLALPGDLATGHGFLENGLPPARGRSGGRETGRMLPECQAPQRVGHVVGWAPAPSVLSAGSGKSSASSREGASLTGPPPGGRAPG